MFVPAFLAWTAAPTSAAPELSVAVPEIVAVSTCAARRFTPTMRKRNTPRTQTEKYLKYFAQLNMIIPPTRNPPPPDPIPCRSKYYKTYPGVKRCKGAPPWQTLRSVREWRGIGSANGNRTRISALKGPRANRCTIAPECGKAWKRFDYPRKPQE